MHAKAIGIKFLSLTIIINDGYNSCVNASVYPTAIWTDAVDPQSESLVRFESNEIIDNWTSEAFPPIRIRS